MPIPSSVLSLIWHRTLVRRLEGDSLAIVFPRGSGAWGSGPGPTACWEWVVLQIPQGREEAEATLKAEGESVASGSRRMLAVTQVSKSRRPPPPSRSRRKGRGLLHRGFGQRPGILSEETCGNAVCQGAESYS